LDEHDFELVHYLLSDPVDVRELRAFAQHRSGNFEALEHRSFHGAAMCIVKRRNSSHRVSSSAGSAACKLARHFTAEAAQLAASCANSEP
jgi:hypothetical protein